MIPGTPNSYLSFLALESVLGQSGQLEKRIENNSQGQILYIGYCLTPSASTSSLIWMILKFTYDGNTFLDYVQLPNLGNGFLYSWDNRASYF